MVSKYKYIVLFRSSLLAMSLLLMGASDVVALTTAERIENLEVLLSRVKLEEVDGKMSYVFGPESCTLPDGTTVTPCGVNVYVRNGSGVTSPTYNGLGNIIIGNNRAPATATPQRTATHSIIVGEEHEYNISTSALFGYQHNVELGIGVLIAGRGHSSSPSGASLMTSILGGIDNELSMSTNNIIAGNTIIGGTQNIAANNMCMISGGFRNLCNAFYSQVVGGEFNRVDAQTSTIGGGYYNEITATGIGATLVGGQQNLAEGPQCSILGGSEQHIYPDALSAAISGGNRGRIYGDYSSISGGDGNTIEEEYASIMGGNGALIQPTGNHGVSLGGFDGKHSAAYGSRLGGNGVDTEGSYSMIFGGKSNGAIGAFSVVVGGNDNITHAQYSAILGGGAFTLGNQAGDSNNSGMGLNSVVLGGKNNQAKGAYCSIGGGNGRTQTANYSYDL